MVGRGPSSIRPEREIEVFNRWNTWGRLWRVAGYNQRPFWVSIGDAVIDGGEIKIPIRGLGLIPKAWCQEIGTTQFNDDDEGED